MKISVIIPVYNAEKYVAQAVESALQFDEVHEVILIEDRSPDKALEVCNSLAEKYSRVKVLQHPDKGNHGAGASRNLGMTHATGDFIAFLDADDYYLPNRFDAEKELFKDLAVEGVYGAIGVHYYSEKAKDQYYHLFGDRLTTVYKKHAPEDVLKGQIGMLGSFGLFSIDALTIRKSCLNKIGPLMKTHLKLHQDTEFLFRLSFYCNLYPGILDQAVAVRGVHESNRITKVDSNQIKPATSKVLLWREVYQWMKEEPRIDKSILIHTQRILQSWEIALAHPTKKIGLIIKGLLADPKSISSGLYNINFRKDFFS